MYTCPVRTALWLHALTSCPKIAPIDPGLAAAAFALLDRSGPLTWS